MAESLFIAQAKLESWMEQGKVLFQDNQLTLLAERVVYDLTPAVRVLALIDGKDEASLIGTIRRLDDLAGMGAEHFQESLILGDTAYQCEDGFVGVRPTSTVAPPSKAAIVSPPVVEPVAEAPKSDADLLTDFLLEHL